ncbi:MAG: hypothetical protein FJW40_26585, partial [Acidobacteria bacterium]|nr:hypothetical protein [Acidobacteriota bacterium]
MLQAQPQLHFSAIGGASALSADGAMRGGASPAASSYTPVNGGAWNIAAGVHATEFMSFQGNYIWTGISILGLPDPDSVHQRLTPVPDLIRIPFPRAGQCLRMASFD